MRGLFARLLAPATPVVDPLAAEIAAGIEQQRQRRIAREGRKRSNRFDHARPKVQQLREEIARQMVDF